MRESFNQVEGSVPEWRNLVDAADCGSAGLTGHTGQIPSGSFLIYSLIDSVAMTRQLRQCYLKYVTSVASSLPTRTGPPRLTPRL